MEKAQEEGVGVVPEVPSSDMSQAVHQEQQETSPRAQAVPQDEEFLLGILRKKINILIWDKDTAGIGSGGENLPVVYLNFR